MNAMSKRAALLVLVLLAATLGVRGETTNAEPEKKHQYVLVLRPKANAAKKEPNLEKIGGKELKRWRKGRLIEVPLSALEHLRKDPTVAYLALVNDGSEPQAPTYVIGEAEEEWAMRVETNGDDTPPLWDSGLYAYDGAGNIKAIGPDTYKYDHVQRLSAAVVGGESLSYTYDSFGNQVQRVIGPAVVPTPTDSLTNHLENADYDPAGNQLSKSGYTREYRYDALNMMVERGTGQPTRYIYTADDERIGVQQSSDWSWTIRDFSGKVLSTFESTDLDELWTWSWVESHHYRDGALTSAIKMEERAGNRPGRYFHLDHLGTPRLITDGTGFKISRHDLHPFGKEQTNYTQEVVDWRYNSIEPMKFTGHERDFVTVLDSNRHDYLDYMHARYYNPPLGRFLSVDPKGRYRATSTPQSWNRYAYATNNPLVIVDPNGEDGVHVINMQRPGEVNARLDSAISARLASIDVSYVTGPSTPRAEIEQILADPTNDVILFGHGVVSQEHGPAQDFMMLTQDGRSDLIGGGYDIQAQTLSLVGCQTSTISLPMNGAVTTTDIYANQAAIFAEALAIQLDNGASLGRGTEAAERTTLTTPRLQSGQPTFNATTRMQVLVDQIFGGLGALPF